MTSSLDRVESALNAAGMYQRSGNWTCPSHEDREPSLHLTSNGQGVAMKCHAGCEVREIVAALDLKMDDLFEEPMKEVARYAYRSAGQVFEKVRFSSGTRKTFRWEPATNGHRLPLYRLDEALSLALPDPVYVIESEKDVDRLLNMGIAATCMPGGAGSWVSEYSEALQGRKVVIVADRDEPGVRHALRVRETLSGARIVQSQTTGEHDDVGDHLAAGYALDELVPYSASSFKRLPLAPLLKQGVPEPVLLCGDMLYAGGLHSIAGPPDCGKTTLALWWARELLREGKTVLFLDEEGGPEIVIEKMAALGVTCDELERLEYVPFPGRRWTEADISDLVELGEETKPAMMLIDSSAAFLSSAALDENHAPDVTKFWSRVLTPMARTVGAAVVVIDHVKKDAEQPSRYARGSGAKLAALDVQIMVEMLRPFTLQQDGMLKYQVTKDRRGRLHRYWKVRVKTGNGFIVPQFDQDVLDEAQEGQIPGPPARKKIYEVLTDAPAGYRQIVDAIVARYGHGLSRTTVSTELNELQRAGYADCLEEGGHGRGSESLWIRRIVSS